MRSIESSSIVAAGFGTTHPQVAGFHRAVPSTTLDKAYMQFDHILSYFLHLSTPICLFFQNILFIIHLWTFQPITGMITSIKQGDEFLEKTSKSI